MGLKNNYLHRTLFDIHKAPQGYRLLASHKTIRLGVPLLAVIYGCVGKRLGKYFKRLKQVRAGSSKEFPAGCGVSGEYAGWRVPVKLQRLSHFTHARLRHVYGCVFS